jgi:membrane-bound inhibitor of C-type lysozyme
MGNFKTVTLCLLTVIFGSCEDEEPYVYQCEDGSVKFELFNDELNPAVRFQDPGSLDMDYEVIQSEDELYRKLEIAYLKKKIDFRTKSLIAISIKMHTLGSVMNQSVTADCTNKKLTVNAELRYGSATVGGVNYVFAIVPKIQSDVSVIFIPKYSR